MIAFTTDPGGEIHRSPLPSHQVGTPGVRVDQSTAVFPGLTGSVLPGAPAVTATVDHLEPITITTSLDPSPTPAADAGWADLSQFWDSPQRVQALPRATVIISDVHRPSADDVRAAPVAVRGASNHGATYLGRALDGAVALTRTGEHVRFVRIDETPEGRRFVPVDYDVAARTPRGLEPLDDRTTAVHVFDDGIGFAARSVGRDGHTRWLLVPVDGPRVEVPTRGLVDPDVKVMGHEVLVWDRNCHRHCSSRLVDLQGSTVAQFRSNGALGFPVCVARSHGRPPSLLVAEGADLATLGPDVLDRRILGWHQPVALSASLAVRADPSCQTVVAFEPTTDERAPSRSFRYVSVASGRVLLERSSADTTRLITAIDQPERGAIFTDGAEAVVFTHEGLVISLPHLGPQTVWSWADDERLFAQVYEGTTPNLSIVELQTGHVLFSFPETRLLSITAP